MYKKVIIGQTLFTTSINSTNSEILNYTDNKLVTELTLNSDKKSGLIYKPYIVGKISANSFPSSINQLLLLLTWSHTFGLL